MNQNEYRVRTINYERMRKKLQAEAQPGAVVPIYRVYEVPEQGREIQVYRPGDQEQVAWKRAIPNGAIFEDIRIRLAYRRANITARKLNGH